MSKGKRYIKGKDGKLAGSLPAIPSLPESKDIPAIPPKPYEEIATSLESVFEKEKEINKTLSEGLADISKAFDAIQEIYEERAQRSAKALEEAKERARISAEKAEAAKINLENILREQEEKKLSNKIRKFFGLPNKY